MEQKVAWQENTQVKYLKFVLYSTWINALNHIPPLLVRIILYMSDFIVSISDSVPVNAADHDHRFLNICMEVCKTCKASKLEGEVLLLEDQDLNMYFLPLVLWWPLLWFFPHSAVEAAQQRNNSSAVAGWLDWQHELELEERILFIISQHFTNRKLLSCLTSHICSSWSWILDGPVSRARGRCTGQGPPAAAADRGRCSG